MQRATTVFASLLCALSGVYASPTGFSGGNPTTHFAAHTRSYFYAGGSYIQSPTGTAIRAEQMYVEHLVPTRVTAKLPIVIIPGNGMHDAHPRS